MITEKFTFFGPVFESLFIADNIPGPTPPGTVFGWKSLASTHAVLVRSDQEARVDLGPLVTAAFLPQINQLLKNNSTITLTSGPFVQIVLWPEVPYFLARFPDHSTTTQLLRVDFNLHIRTPWWMSDADTNVSFYIFARLEGGHLVANVDGAWVIVNGGWPDGQAIADDLGAAAIQAIPNVQSAINSALAPFAAATFSTIYFIPGNGTTFPVFVGSPTLDTTLAVVP